MTIDSNHPHVSALCGQVEKIYKKHPGCSSDFQDLCEDIKHKTKLNISQSTLERLWGYGRVRYSGIALHTLDVLSIYIGYKDWTSFLCHIEKQEDSESDEFKSTRIISRNLKEGTRLKIGWNPNRECIIRYLGNDRFVAEECFNSTMQPGASFTCYQFQIGRELLMNDFYENVDDKEDGKSYVVGMNTGLLYCEML